MNENIDLTEILKNCPEGTRLYSSVYGEVELTGICDSDYPIRIRTSKEINYALTKDGKCYINYKDTECILFPSKDQRDWSKFKIDLPIDTPVMVLTGSEWYLRYYAGNGKCYVNGFKSKDAVSAAPWKYIIPFNRFNPDDIEESLDYNIVDLN